MEKTMFGATDANSQGSEDKTHTILTGFNTDEHLEEYDQLLDEVEIQSDKRRSKSEGTEVRIPFVQNVDGENGNLKLIKEEENSNDSYDALSPEKRMIGEIMQTPSSRFKSHPLGYKGFGSDVKKLLPIHKNSKLDIEAVLRQAENSKKKNIMRSHTLTKDSDSDDNPEGHWADLPDPTEKRNVKLSKKQRVYEAGLQASLLRHWDEIFKVAVVKKGRKIILSKDEYSIDYDIKNRRELILPSEYYLNLTTLEKYYHEEENKKNLDWEVKSLRMYLARRYDVKSDLIHLNNVSMFCKVPMVDLIRRRFKPYQSKLMMKVKKRIKLKHARVKVDITKGKRLGVKPQISMPNAKAVSGALHRIGGEKKEIPEEANSPKNEDDDSASNISDHLKAERMSILDLIKMFSDKIKDVPKAYNKFCNKNNNGKGFMNIFSFNSLIGVELGLKLTSANKHGLFSVIDYNADGYATEKEFLSVFAVTEQQINEAIKDPINYMDGLILDFVIEQIYNDILFFKGEGLKEIEQKLDANGRIDVDRLEKYLGFYNAKLTPFEKEFLAATGVKDEKKNKIMVPFRKLIEKTMSRINLRINFRLNLKRQDTTIYTEEESRKKRLIEMEKYYEEQQRLKEEREKEEERLRLLKKEKDEEYSQYESDV